MQNQFNNIRGFSPQSIWRMKQFFETYKELPKLSTLLREISWSSHLHILSKTKSFEEKEFYLILTKNERLSVRKLERQINSGVFERTMLADKKVTPVVAQTYPEIQNIFKDTYVFEFLDLPKEHNENDLQKALIRNLKSFLLELGKGFTFIGEEYRVQVGMHDYYIDLLLFNRTMQCLVAIELKPLSLNRSFLVK